MKQLKSHKEIAEIIKGLPNDRKALLRNLTMKVFHDGNADAFNKIDNNFVYPIRWDLFEHLTDTELIYDEDDVNEFIDVCIGLFLGDAE